VRALSGRTRRRLITLYGPGGIGKTRLALTVAAAMIEQFPGGVYLIDLAPIESGPWIEVAIANALGVRDDNPTALDAMIMAHLRDRRTLLILDNCEHLIAPCAALVGRLLASAPDLQIVATTREPLGLPGELVRRLSALSLPPTADPEGAATDQLSAIAASEAVQLFVARAALVSPGFTLRAENAVAIAAICRRLDGLPLALELAASRLTALPLDTLAAELDLALQVGGGGRRGVHARQRTIRATLDWSYALLSMSERALLRRLASFAGTWSASAAATVCGDQSTPDLPDLLASLVAKSLINVETGGQQAADTPGRGALPAAGNGAPVCARQATRSQRGRGAGSRLCDWAIETLESVASPLDGGPDGTRWLARVETELTNLRAARAWALEHDPPRALRLISATWPYAFARLGHDAGRYLLRLALEVAPGPSPWRAAALQGLGFLSLFHDLSAARGHLAEALALAEATGEVERLRALRWQLAFACVTAGAIGEAEQHLALGWSAVADDPHPGRRSPYRIVRGFVAIARGDFPRARHELSEAEREAVSAEQPLFRCIALARLGALHLRYGHLTVATANFTALVALAERLGSWFYRCVGRTGLAQVLEWSGELATAEAAYADALAISVESGGSRLERAMVLLGHGRIALYRREPALALARLEEGYALVIQLNHGTLRRDFASPLAFAFWRNGQFTRATEQFDDALTLNATGDPTTLARCLDGLAYLAVERGDGGPRSALAGQCRGAARTGPDDPPPDRAGDDRHCPRRPRPPSQRGRTPPANRPNASPARKRSPAPAPGSPGSATSTPLRPRHRPHSRRPTLRVAATRLRRSSPAEGSSHALPPPPLPLVPPPLRIGRPERGTPLSRLTTHDSLNALQSIHAFRVRLFYRPRREAAGDRQIRHRLGRPRVVEDEIRQRDRQRRPIREPFSRQPPDRRPRPQRQGLRRHQRG
jgi:predicted ATPase